MKRSMVIKHEGARFPARAGKYPAIDRIDIALYLDRHHGCWIRPCIDVTAIVSGESLGLSRSISPKLDWLPGTRVPFLGWEHEGLRVKQWLGEYGGRRADNRTTQSITFNPIAEVARTHATCSRKGSARRGPAKHNFVHPSTMSMRELHRRTVKVAIAIITQCKSDYVALLRHLFNVHITESDVRCSVTAIETCWDVVCSNPRLQLRAAHEPWLRGLPEARVAVLGKASRPIDWEYSAWADGTLRAQHTKGHNSKMYASSRDTMRYEAQIFTVAQNKLIGHRIRTNNMCDFREDVQQLGAAAYVPILEVQRELTEPHVMSFEDFLCAGVDPRRRASFHDIICELRATGRTRTVNAARYRVLCTMRDRGCVQITKPKGWWAATARFSLAMKSFERWAEVYGS